MSGYIDKIFDRTIPLLQTNLTLRMKRGEALVSNITNAETPGYRAIDVNFGGQLEQALGQGSSELKVTRSGHMNTVAQSGMSHLIPDFSGATRADGNNVDLDIQMGRLASNSGKFSSSASLIRKKLHMLRMAIRFAQR
jgi:flagellar basal-body rod protein FlgB